MTKALFGKEAKDFLEIYHPFFCIEREKYGDEEVGLILEKLVKEIKQEEENTQVKFVKQTEKINSQDSLNCNYIQEYNPEKLIAKK